MRRTRPASAPGAVRGGIARETRSVIFGGARRAWRAPRTWLFSVLALALAAAMALAQEAGEPPPQGAGPGQQQPSGPPSPRSRAAFAPQPPPDDGQLVAGVPDPPIAYRSSRALGLPYAHGRLVRGVQLPAQGRDYFTWDPVFKQSPNRGWRRWATDDLIRTLLKVLAETRSAHPEAQRIGIGDLSRPGGGGFGRRFGGLGHASHQNGLDADVYYPRVDGLERRAHEPALVDRELAQELVDRFVEAGAEKVFVGPRLGLRGPRGIVVSLVHHDDHLHVRIRAGPE